MNKWIIAWHVGLIVVALIGATWSITHETKCHKRAMDALDRIEVRLQER
jgi:hypothetical protein